MDKNKQSGVHQNDERADSIDSGDRCHLNNRKGLKLGIAQTLPGKPIDGMCGSKILQRSPGDRRQQKNMNRMTLAKAIDEVSEQADIQTQVGHQQTQDQPTHYHRDVSIIDESVSHPTEGNEVKDKAGHKTKLQGPAGATCINGEK